MFRELEILFFNGISETGHFLCALEALKNEVSLKRKSASTID